MGILSEMFVKEKSDLHHDEGGRPAGTFAPVRVLRQSREATSQADDQRPAESSDTLFKCVSILNFPEHGGSEVTANKDHMS